MSKRRHFFVLLLCASASTASAVSDSVDAVAEKGAKLSNATSSPYNAELQFLHESVKVSKAQFPKQEKQPFWRGKESLEKRMRDERFIAVSVRSESAANKGTKFTIVAGGIVAQTRSRSFAIAQRYEDLQKVSDHFKTVKFNPTNQRLFIVAQALGYQERMILEMRPLEGKTWAELQWQNVWGRFKGMTGVIRFTEITEGQTEISIQSAWEGEHLPLPKVLLGLAFEVIVQKVAQRMRDFIEHAEVASPSAQQIQ